MADELWDALTKGAGLQGDKDTGSIDNHLSGTPFEGGQYTSMRALTDKNRAKNALTLPVDAGTRVEFASNLGAVLTYADPPDPKAQGTVVTVRSATGDLTEHNGKVFVKWDDGRFLGIHAEHLRFAHGRHKRGGPPSRIRVACLGDLSDFMKVADNTLIHRSTRDLWSVRQDGQEFVIERLFESTGDPLKG